MKQVLLAATLGLALVTGCGSGSDSDRQSLRSTGESTPDPAPHSSTALASPEPDKTGPRDRPTPSHSPRASTLEPSPSASLRPAPTSGATAGSGSAGPAATSGPAPTRSPSPSPSRPGPLIITEEDSGATFSIRRDTRDAALRLGGGWQWDPPEVNGSSVELVQRQFVRDPGYSEWEIRPVDSGTTTIRSTGGLECHQAEPPCAAPNRLFEVRIVVS